MEVLSYILTAIGAYLLGSIPTGYLVARAKGVDIRSVGSGNIGATNVFRILGKKAGIFVLTSDALKGFLAVWLVPMVVLKLLSAISGRAVGTTEHLEWLTIIGGICAVLGHNYTCWLNFKGGKGIATSAGVMIALFPMSFLICLGIWIIVFIASKYVSLASIIAAAWLPITAIFFSPSRKMIVVAFLMGALAIYKHRANIARLMDGTENRFGKKKEEAKKEESK